MADGKKKLLLVDGHSILNRAFYGMPDLTNAKGAHTGAVYGFLNILFSQLEEAKPDYLAVAFDVHAPTFRHEAYADYKGTRKPMPEELREQVPLMKKVLSAMGIAIYEQAGLEADDILGTLAKKAEGEDMDVVLLSGDRDLLQVASDRICVRIPRTARGQTQIRDFFAAGVLEEYGVTPLQFIQVKALMGDTSDNIPGVPKVGEKTATQLIRDYGSVDGVYAHLDQIKKPALHKNLADNEDLARMSLFLATIKTDCAVELDRAQAASRDFYTREAFELCTELGFKNFLPRFDRAVVEKGEEGPAAMGLCEDGAGLDALWADILEAFPEGADPAAPGGWEAPDALDGASGGSARGVIGVWPVLDRAGYGMAAPSALVGAGICYEKADGAAVRCFVRTGERLAEERAAGFLKDLRVFARTGRAEAAVFALKDHMRLWGVDPGVEFAAGIRLEGMLDLLVCAYLANPLKSDYAIEDVASEYLGLSLQGKKQVFGKKTWAQAMEDQAEDVAAYACRAADALRQAAPLVRDRLKDQGMWGLYTDMERPLTYILADMERLGVRILPQALASYSEKLGARIDELEQQIYDQTGETFNIASPKQLGEVLFEKMGLPGSKKTKTGYSTAAGVLEKLAPDYPVVNDILEYRGLTKLRSTYADGLMAYVADDGRIHTTLTQTITATGRISSTDPNLQNIPMKTDLGRQIRKAFIPEDGYSFTDADYSQIELRILAHMSGDPGLIEAYRENEDIHRITASKVFHTPLAEVTPLQRRNAKAVNFGIVYGISSFGLSQGLSISRQEAADYIKAYFKTYPGIKVFLDKLVADAKTYGYAATMYGRRRPVPELASSNFMQRSFGERIAMNSPIQGSAADIMKIAMIRVWQRILAEGLRSRLVLQIHDELLVETAPGEEDQVRRILREEMEGAADLAVRLETDIHGGADWYMAK